MNLSSLIINWECGCRFRTLDFIVFTLSMYNTIYSLFVYPIFRFLKEKSVTNLHVQNNLKLKY